MKSSLRIFVLLLLLPITSFAQLPRELPLWKNGIPDNPVKYKEEKMRSESYRQSSLSRMNRVFSCVSTPAYIIHKPEKGTGNGVAMVVCPGGGFRDVWFDREGNDFGLWLAQHGVTALVLKYRTYNTDAEGFKLPVSQYFTEVYADAKQAINILRSNAKELGLDEHKIGIGGFSAGGALSLRVILEMSEKELPAYTNLKGINTRADFAGLFYPGLDPNMIKLAGEKNEMAPVFIMNGGEDTTTPAINCIELYKKLIAKKLSAELHIYAKGGHGFDSGIERGNGVSTWRDSFIAWLKDEGFIQNTQL
jgi:acetyl esterase/lipase